MKTIYLTTKSDQKLSIKKALEYCKQKNLELQSVMCLNVNRMINEPEKVVQYLKQQKCQIVITDDNTLLFPEIANYERTLLKELKAAEIECIHFEFDMSLLELARHINMQRSEILTKQEHKIKGVIIYQGDENSRNELEFQNLAEILKEKIQDNKYGVLFYREEHCDVFCAISNIIENNPVECILMQHPFITEEGIEILQELKEKGLEIEYHEDMEVTQGQRLWNIS